MEYIVKRGQFVAGMVEVARVSDTTFKDSGLENGKTYVYVVVAVNSLGAGAECEPVEGTPLGPPAAPGIFRAVVKGKTVVLTWGRPTGSDRVPVTGYIILRTTAGGEFEEIARVGDVTSYTDETVKEGTGYTYKVTSLSDIGEGGTTADAEVKLKKADEGPGFQAILLIIAMLSLAALAWKRDERR